MFFFLGNRYARTFGSYFVGKERYGHLRKERILESTARYRGEFSKKFCPIRRSEIFRFQKLNIGIKQLDTKLADEVSKIKSGFVLDINLERSRAKEDVSPVSMGFGSLEMHWLCSKSKSNAKSVSWRIGSVWKSLVCTRKSPIFKPISKRNDWTWSSILQVRSQESHFYDTSVSKPILGTFLTAAGLIVSVGFISIRLLKS